MPIEHSSGSASRDGLIVLAAGESRRLGRPKQLLEFEGQTLLRRAIGVGIEAGCAPVVVVFGAGAKRLREECAGLPVTVAVNADWEEGMASSIRCGLGALEGGDAVAILLVDQPRVTASALRALLDQRRASGKPAGACALGDGALGPPCVFDQSLFAELRELRGAQGAKQLLRRLSPSDIFTMELPEAGVDIDTDEDWSRFRETSS